MCLEKLAPENYWNCLAQRMDKYSTEEIQMLDSKVLK